LMGEGRGEGEQKDISACYNPLPLIASDSAELVAGRLERKFEPLRIHQYWKPHFQAR
jgi:hypothetical protein